MALAFKLRGHERDTDSETGQSQEDHHGPFVVPLGSDSESESDQESNPSASDLPITMRTLSPYMRGPRRPVVFILGDDSGTDSSESLSQDSMSDIGDLFDHMDDSPSLRRTRSLPDLKSLFHPLDWAYAAGRSRMKVPALRWLLFGDPEYNSLRDKFFASWDAYNGDPWALTTAESAGNTQRPRQLTRAFLGRRTSEGGGECIRESWQQFMEEDLVNIYFRHVAGLGPVASPNNSLDGAWNDDLDSGIDARFRPSGDAPFLTRERWLRGRLAWPGRSGSHVHLSGRVRGSSGSMAGTVEEDEEWVWCDTIPETFENGEWDGDVVKPEEDERVEEESLPSAARGLLTRAFRRLRGDLSR